MATIHKMLLPWDNATRWTNLGPKPGPDFFWDFRSNVSAVTKPADKQIVADVTDLVQGWSDDPDSNHGLAFLGLATHSNIRVADSKLDQVKSVKVNLHIKTAKRGEIVATLRHGAHTALLINRLGQKPCNASSGSGSADIDVTLDDTAPSDIHFAGSELTPLTGTYRPDGYCISRPLCTKDGKGLCGQTGDGDWTLSVHDEWVATPSGATLVSWSIDLSDGVHPDEHYENNHGAKVKYYPSGGAAMGRIYSSEHPNADQRPALTVVYEPTLVFSTRRIEALPGSTHTVSLGIPKGANDKVDVKVKVKSDKPQVAKVLQDTLFFAKGGDTIQTVQVSAGDKGLAALQTSNDAGVADASLTLVVAQTPITAHPMGLYHAAGTQDAKLQVAIPEGSNTAKKVQVVVASSNTKVANFDGAPSKKLDFPAGASTKQTVSVTLGASVATAEINVQDPSGIWQGTVVPVSLSLEEPVELDLYVQPYLQIGDVALDAKDGTTVIMWQTIERSRGGANADHFELQFRKKGDQGWASHPLDPPTNGDSKSRWNHTATLTGLALETHYEYRLVHLRNGAPLPGGTYQRTFRSTAKNSFRFTGFGNSGNGDIGQRTVAARLEKLASHLHFLLGDFVYYKGEYEHFKSRVFAPYAKTFASVVFSHTTGNHEAQQPLALPVLQNFRVPSNGPKTQKVLGHSFVFDYGNSRFYSVDSSGTTNMATSGKWLAGQLAASNKTWNIVLTHEPPVTRDPYKVDRQESAEVRKHLLKAAVEGGADLFIAGAVHSYQRYLPITKVLTDSPDVEAAPCEQGKGTTLVYPGTGAWVRDPLKPVGKLPPPMVKYILKTGVGVFDVDGDKLTVQFIDALGNVHDKLVRTKCSSAGACPCP
jgi:subtilisin-like proprotein convertase family protein